VVRDYGVLRDWLLADGRSKVVATFAELDQLLLGGLPDSARRYRLWWRTGDAGKNVHARAWLEAGYQVEMVDPSAGIVTFVSVGGN